MKNSKQAPTGDAGPCEFKGKAPTLAKVPGFMSKIKGHNKGKGTK